MPTEPALAALNHSPASSGRASPNLRAGRKVEEAALKADKSTRRYAASIEKALYTFEPKHQEWADYIAFLARLLKAIQSVKQADVIPHAALVSLRLAQCLNPTLPSGVHQKALEVYSNIFGILGSESLGRDLQLFLPGVLPILSFASLTVRPLFYSLFEDHILKLDFQSLRPALKSLILSLLPGIEDETSEDFERGIQALDRLRTRAQTQDAAEDVGGGTNHVSFFWQCFFLSVMTGATKRQGALAFLLRRLPSFRTAAPAEQATVNGDLDEAASGPALSDDAQTVINPDPGLLLRCFAAGLRDANILVQRGFLDLLVTNLPLQSSVLQKIAQANDLDLLVSATVGVVLRRDMSLNRRLWSWYLGPDPTTMDAGGEEPPKTPLSDTGDFSSTKQAAYFQQYGSASLERCILGMFAIQSSDAADAARPFRICSALMDRWEIGSCIVPPVFLQALRSAYRYHSNTTDGALTKNVMKSASLFFDGIESSLIWSQIINDLSDAISLAGTNRTTAEDNLRFLVFVLTKFNIREEDMLINHIPKAVLVALYGSTQVFAAQDYQETSSLESLLLDLILQLTTVIPEHALAIESADSLSSNGDRTKIITDERCALAVRHIKQSARDLDDAVATPSNTTLAPSGMGSLLQYMAVSLFRISLTTARLHALSGRCGEIVSGLMAKTRTTIGVDVAALERNMETSLAELVKTWTESGSHFIVATSIVSVWSDIDDLDSQDEKAPSRSQVNLLALEYLWLALSSSCPKYHVEAARMIWKLHALSAGTQRVADVDVFVSRQLADSENDNEQIGRFMALWELTLQNQPSRNERRAGIQSRRASSFASTNEITSEEAQKTLLRPLKILLDNLSSSESEYSSSIAAWLGHLQSIDKILSSLILEIETGLRLFSKQVKLHGSHVRTSRAGQQVISEMQIAIEHLTAVLLRGSANTWRNLVELKPHEDEAEEGAPSGIQSLAAFCVQLIEEVDNLEFEGLQRRLLRLLNLLFDAESASTLQSLHLEDRLILSLQRIIEHGPASLQIDYLALLSSVLRVRESTSQMGDRRSSSRSLDVSAKMQDAPSQLSIETDHYPPQSLFSCIRQAIASASARSVLEHWMTFLNAVLSVYSQAMFSEMIPLVELFCNQINASFRHLRTMSVSPESPTARYSISSLPWLLNGLEAVLASGHSNLAIASPDQPSARQVTSPQTFFGASAMNILSPIAGPNKTAKSNSRLTVILCLHDTVKVCFNMWSWSTYGSESETIDPASAATTNLNALKLRNRTKKILEHLFTAEALESLEMLILIWVQTKTKSEADIVPESVLGILNVLSSSRPRNTMPLILNSLYSRTNIEALEASRRSSLTCDLSALDVVGFLLEYVTVTEDDALDEIWSDCMTFLRDVLANPMPHRQVLPALLELIALLAEKIDNTNFGELQRMHRELADIFSRLLTASFTIKPTAGSLEAKGGNKIHSGDLFISLTRVTPKLQIVLESKDRVLSTVNNLTTYVISPIFHAKAFPENIKPELLQLILLMSTQAPEAKLWRREVNDAFSDPRAFSVPADTIKEHWFGVLRKWSMAEKDVVTEILSRIVAPSTATLMFGVGANSARITADRTAQYNLRRTALLLLASDHDGLLTSVQSIDHKLAELCTASPASSPSSATRAEAFMLWRALFLTTSEVHLAGLWPTLNAVLQAALLSILPDSSPNASPTSEADTYNNLSLLQACKLLDLLALLQPDDFQLHEWIYLTNTIDALYASAENKTSAIADEVADSLANSAPATTTTASDAAEKKDETEVDGYNRPGDDTTAKAGLRRPILALVQLDAGDAKAMARDDFVRQVLLPFFSGLSMATYEGAYAMTGADLEVCRRDLLLDLMESGTVV